MTDYRWIRVSGCDSVPLREGRAIRLTDRELAIFNLGDRFLAIDNECPHRGGPLADGIVSGAFIVCPLHAWKIDLESGRVERPTTASASCLTTYPVRVEEDTILVGIPVDTPAAAAGRAKGEAA